ncbi:MAG: hypothetical protein WC750_03350 [Patescibacteria group bacterium]
MQLHVISRNVCIILGLIGSAFGFAGSVLIVPSHSTIGWSDSVVILDDSGKVVDVPQQTRWAKPSSQIRLTREAQAKASVQPITDNPKVRRLELTVDTKIADAGRFVESMNIKGGLKCEAEADKGYVNQQRDAVLFQLYEFMNAHSRELGNFYNPYDPQQTRDLEALMHTHMDAPLATKGLRLVKLAKWTTD